MFCKKYFLVDNQRVVNKLSTSEYWIDIRNTIAFARFRWSFANYPSRVYDLFVATLSRNCAILGKCYGDFWLFWLKYGDVRAKTATGVYFCLMFPPFDKREFFIQKYILTSWNPEKCVFIGDRFGWTMNRSNLTCLKLSHHEECGHIRRRPRVKACERACGWGWQGKGFVRWQCLYGMSSRVVGFARNAAFNTLTNLVYNLCRFEQVLRIGIN